MNLTQNALAWPEDVGGEGKSLHKLGIVPDIILPALAFEPTENALLLCQGIFISLKRQVDSTWLVTHSETESLQRLVGESVSFDGRKKSVPIRSGLSLTAVGADASLYFRERAFHLLQREQTAVRLVSPNPTYTHPEYLAQLNASAENGQLSDTGLTAKGLKLLTVTESFLHAPSLNVSERLDGQIDYLASLSLSDFQLYRAARAGRDLWLAQLIEAGLGHFESAATRRYWLRHLRALIPPLWEINAITLRMVSRKNNLV